MRPKSPALSRPRDRGSDPAIRPSRDADRRGGQASGPREKGPSPKGIRTLSRSKGCETTRHTEPEPSADDPDGIPSVPDLEPVSNPLMTNAPSAAIKPVPADALSCRKRSTRPTAPTPGRSAVTRGRRSAALSSGYRLPPAGRPVVFSGRRQESRTGRSGQKSGLRVSGASRG
jgi:hypothetical protein